MFTGDLLPSNHAAYSLDPFALWTAFPPSMVGRYSHDYYGSSATPRRQQRTVRLPRSPKARRAPPGRFPRSPLTGRQGRRPAVPRGHRRALPQHGTRPRPARTRNGRARRSSAATRTEHPNSPQPPVSGLLPSLGASNTGSSPTPFCLATAPSPLAADRCSIVRGCSRPPPHLWSRTAPQLHPTVTAAGGGSFHPTRSYGASWRTCAPGEERVALCSRCEPCFQFSTMLPRCSRDPRHQMRPRRCVRPRGFCWRQGSEPLLVFPAECERYRGNQVKRAPRGVERSIARWGRLARNARSSRCRSGWGSDRFDARRASARASH